MHIVGSDLLLTPIQDLLFQQKSMMLTRKQRRNSSTISRKLNCMSKWFNSFRSCSSSMVFSLQWIKFNSLTFILSYLSRYVLVSPKERKVVIVESVLCPTEIRETLAKVLFRHFEVSFTIRNVRFRFYFLTLANFLGIVCIVCTNSLGCSIDTSGGNSFSY